uniref:Ran-binding protein 3-like n=1 Tax=Sinocyclocheilus rhinocerous TaxID=307959 RepID=A0A673LGP5_9TELE
MADLANEEKPAIAPPVFVFQKDKAQKRSADGSSAEDGDDSDRDDGEYCPPVKRERTSSLTQFPPSHSVPKNNIFMPSSLCQSPTGNSDSEPEEKPVGFRLKPPTLIHGQAPSAGVPSQKPKEQQRSVLRPAVLQAPPAKTLTEPAKTSTYISYNAHCWLSQQQNLWRPQSVLYRFIFQAHFVSNNATNSSDKGSKFVFGQNMSERVLVSGYHHYDIFLCVCVSDHSVTESLEESAAAYTKATAKKCILEKVEVRTGEEAESNVLQMQCKLFVFDKPAQSWVERGRGLLRLNDMASTDDGSLQSRLVMRTQGSLRLILNTKLWPQMQVDKASEKSVRITAMDTEDQGVKVFLISASSKDAGQLAAALHHRILALRSRVEQEAESAPLPAEPEIPQSNEDDSDDDEPTNNNNSTGTGNSTASGTDTSLYMGLN